MVDLLMCWYIYSSKLCDYGFSTSWLQLRRRAWKLDDCN